MPRPDVIPMPTPVHSDGLWATECHPLPDGGMRCDPVVTEGGRGVAILVVLTLAFCWGYLLFDNWRERRRAREANALLRKWGMRRIPRDD